MTKDCKHNNKPTKIVFGYKTIESVMGPVPALDGAAWVGWAPAFDPVTKEKIGYINFTYVQQPKYINATTPDGFFNTVKIYFVFDKLQIPGTVELKDFVTQMNFSSTLANQRLPVGIYKAGLFSTSLKISKKSNVRHEVLPDGNRLFTLNIDWE